MYIYIQYCACEVFFPLFARRFSSRKKVHSDCIHARFEPASKIFGVIGPRNQFLQPTLLAI